MAKNKEATLDDLLIQAKLTNRLLAAPLKEKLGQQGLVKLLMSTGASTSDIADVLDTTAATIATTMQRLKKSNKSKEPGAGPTPESEPGSAET